MKTILYQLYHGEIDPAESIDFSPTSYDEIHEKIEQKLDYFKDALSEEEIQKLMDMEALYSKCEETDAFLSFEVGFQLGVLLMVEIFMAKEKHSK